MSTGFSFGGGTPNPAPAPGGFSFGSGNTTPPSSNTTSSTAPPPAFGAAPTAAPTSGFSFGGGTTPAPGAPAAPAGGLFGSTQPAPAAPAGGFGFGATTTPAPPSFGAPAPTGGFGFGGGGGFGSTTPAPAFGSTTPVPAFGAGGFNNAAAAGPTGFPNAAALNLNGKTPYSALPPEYQKAIDTIHDAMMKHKRSMNQVQAMGPQALIPTNGDDAIPPKVKKLQQRLNLLQKDVASVQVVAEQYRDGDRHNLEQSYVYAKWPTEAMAARKGVRLSGGEEKKDNDPDLQAQLREMLERQIPYVDRIERMPSPYLWQVLDQMSLRLKSLIEEVTKIHQQLESSRSLDGDVVDLIKIVENQEHVIYVLRRDIHKIHYDMEKLRKTYTAFETGENVLEKAQLEEWERQKLVSEQIQMQLLRSVPDSKPGNPALPGQTPAAPATSGFAFGPTPGAPAPSSGFSFAGGAAPTPAAPAFGAPAPGAPAASGFSFGGAAPTPAAPAFGAAPAPALGAAPTPAFGAAPATPAFGIAKPATSTPSKNKKSGGGSRKKAGR